MQTDLEPYEERALCYTRVQMAEHFTGTFLTDLSYNTQKYASKTLNNDCLLVKNMVKVLVNISRFPNIIQ